MKKKRQTPKQKYYQKIFDHLCDIAVSNPMPPKKILEAWDTVLDFIGDVASGRRR